ncbi:hypothetical protein ACU610_21245 [Geodermatophilus sp. URMC 61]|uniref:hypothetical protein n=1 Tax=Geodermatophilus sp. URMC 61 TaxID=3423411 RepID=UPI00406CAF02
MTQDDPKAPPPLPPAPSAAPTKRAPRRSKPSSPAPAAVPPRPAPTAPTPPVPDAWEVVTRLRPLEEVVAALGASGAAQHSLASAVTTYQLADGPVLVDPAEVLAVLATPPVPRAA